jgi:acetoin utilization deacetylase AcuC-like enzyme
MNIYYSETHKQHNPPFEIFDGGEKVPNFEVPERAERILTSLKLTKLVRILSPEDFGLEPILEVHENDYIEFLQTAFEEWLQTETDAPYEKSALLPATFPPRNWQHKPKSLLGRAGYYMHDLSAPITAGTYRAALASAHCALSAAKAITAEEKSSFALCRPPGHHAGRSSCAGYCYINNAAVAANWLSKRGRTAILDIDYHAGNGTQDIFYQRGDVLTISIHADPDYEYPYFCGYAEETGAGKGFGFHHNFPLPQGTDTRRYLDSLRDAMEYIKSFDADYLVISAGMDLFEGDPLGKFIVTKAGIHQIGQEIASLSLRNLIVMEGGYNNSALGENIVTFLEAFR